MTNAAKIDVDPETLSMIRGMLADEEAQEQIASNPAPARFAHIHDPDAAEFVERRSAPQPHLEVYTAPKPRFRLPRLPSLGGWRPSPRMMIGGAVLAVLLLRPAWVVLAVVLSLFAVLGAFVLLGSDRVWGLCIAGLRHYMARHPARAPQIAARVDRFAERWDRVLDLMPDGTVDGLYFPDLQSLMDAEDRHDAAVADRLDRLRSEA
ncbi:MAG: hypothetical protein AAFY38_17205 [Pseudomonadota bacterium]